MDLAKLIIQFRVLARADWFREPVYLSLTLGGIENA
jgi:hypothetical protein